MVQQIDLKLRQMRLAGMALGWQALNETKQVFELSFSEGLEILIEREEEERKNNRFNRMIKGAKFRYQASLEELSYEPSRGLNKSMIASLATCQYITKGKSVLITGATGCGKSYLASALGHQACLHGHSVIYSNVSEITGIRMFQTIFQFRYIIDYTRIFINKALNTVKDARLFYIK